MPPFPERESSILAKLKKKKGPSTVTDLEEAKRERSADVNGGPEPAPASASAAVGPLLRAVPCVSSWGTWSPRSVTLDCCRWGRADPDACVCQPDCVCRMVVWRPRSAPTSPLGFGFRRRGHPCLARLPYSPAPLAGFQWAHLLLSSEVFH